MSRKIAVFTPGSHPTRCYVKKAVAQRRVEQGWAKWLVDGLSIQLLPLDAKTLQSAIPSGQGDIYELAAIDTHPCIYLGGLTRTEHKPAQLKPFHAARVGHQ